MRNILTNAARSASRAPHGTPNAGHKGTAQPCHHPSRGVPRPGAGGPIFRRSASLRHRRYPTRGVARGAPARDSSPSCTTTAAASTGSSEVPWNGLPHPTGYLTDHVAPPDGVGLTTSRLHGLTPPRGTGSMAKWAVKRGAA